jgi:hypothetical protein
MSIVADRSKPAHNAGITIACNHQLAAWMPRFLEEDARFKPFRKSARRGIYYQRPIDYCEGA